MDNRNNRQQGTGLHEGWRRAPEPERVLREPRPGARRHALMLGGLGVVGALAALLFAPQLRVPIEAESGSPSISRKLYPKAPGSPTVAPVQPGVPQAVVEVPSVPEEPVESTPPAESAAKPETAPAADPSDVVIREVPSRPAARESRRSTPSPVAESSPSRAARSESSDSPRRSERRAGVSSPRPSERTAANTSTVRTTRRSTTPASSDSKRLARALNSRAYRLQKQGRHREAEPLLREALRHDPNYAYAQYNLGWALVEQGRGSEAISPLRKTARQQPERWEPKAKLREAYSQASRSERSERSTRRRSTRRTASTSERETSSSRRRIASNSGRESSTRRTASTRRTTRAITSTAGWKGSTDPKEQAFLKAWQDFKTKEEREEEERRRFIRRVSEDLIADPRE